MYYVVIIYYVHFLTNGTSSLIVGTWYYVSTRFMQTTQEIQLITLPDTCYHIYHRNRSKEGLNKENSMFAMVSQTSISDCNEILYMKPQVRNDSVICFVPLFTIFFSTIEYSRIIRYIEKCWHFDKIQRIFNTK